MNTEETNKMTELRAQILNEGMKGLFLMNGGGIVALATWLQSVWGKPWAEPMLLLQVIAIGIFAFGVIFGAVVPFARYMGSLHEKATFPKENPWWWAHVISTVLSILSFAVASGFVVCGALRALCQSA